MPRRSANPRQHRSATIKNRLGFVTGLLLATVIAAIMPFAMNRLTSIGTWSPTAARSEATWPPPTSSVGQPTIGSALPQAAPALTPTSHASTPTSVPFVVGEARDPLSTMSLATSTPPAEAVLHGDPHTAPLATAVVRATAVAALSSDSAQSLTPTALLYTTLNEGFVDNSWDGPTTRRRPPSSPRVPTGYSPASLTTSWLLGLLAALR